MKKMVSKASIEESTKAKKINKNISIMEKKKRAYLASRLYHLLGIKN